MWFETPKAFVEFREVFRGRSRAQIASFWVLLGVIIIGIASNIN